MKIILWALGSGAKKDEKVEIERSQFCVFTMYYNLENKWAWRDVIKSDGPCVAVKFENA